MSGTSSSSGIRFSQAVFVVTTVLYMTVLFYVSVKPAVSSGEGITIQKIVHNALHIPAYALLVYLVWECFNIKNARAQIFAFIAAVMYGSFNEMIQSFLPSRSASWSDIALNAAGAGFIITMVRMGVIKSRRKRTT